MQTCKASAGTLDCVVPTNSRFMAIPLISAMFGSPDAFLLPGWITVLSAALQLLP